MLSKLLFALLVLLAFVNVADAWYGGGWRGGYGGGWRGGYGIFFRYVIKCYV